MRRAPFAYDGRLWGMAGGLAGLLMAWPVLASSPATPLKLSATNTVSACYAAPKLMAHVAQLNPQLDPKFRDIAAQYASQGEKLGLRWDHAFFQMLVETNNLSFSGDTVRGELTKDHNNFANIRSADGDEPDHFADVSTGVLAHLHHIRLYAGDPVSKPAAKRTKQVENFILSWSRQLKRPVRFDDMLGRWSPGNPGYARTIDKAMKAFESANCAGDSAGEVAARDDNAPPRKAGRKSAATVSAPASHEAPATVSAEPAKSAAAATTDPMPSSAASGFGEPIRTTKPAAAKQVAVANSTPPAQPASSAESVTSAPQQPAVENASVSGAAAAAGSAQCKVWSASFGGDKSVLIKVNDGQITHFTALQVNAGREKEETTAYIAAYARGGRSVGEFTTADQAINKAFELCPKT